MRLHVGVLFAAACTLTACGGLLQDTEEVANSTGDVMSSFDEAGQGGSFAYLMPLRRTDYSSPTFLQRVSNAVIPSAEASGACVLETFSACSNGDRNKMFDDCTFGASSLSGSVDLAFSQSDCSLMNVGDSVTRTANFTLTGASAASLTVSAPNGGQTITKTADGWSYSVGGMERIGKDSKGTTQFDISTTTLSDISVTGNRRDGRVMTGGQLQVKHNLAGYTAVLTPNNITWNATCNCAVSGSFAGTVTNEAGKSESFTVDITGCGKATVTTQSKTKDVTLDRCAGI